MAWKLEPTFVVHWLWLWRRGLESHWNDSSDKWWLANTHSAASLLGLFAWHRTLRDPWSVARNSELNTAFDDVISLHFIHSWMRGEHCYFQPEVFMVTVRPSSWLWSFCNQSPSFFIEPQIPFDDFVRAILWRGNSWKSISWRWRLYTCYMNSVENCGGVNITA